MRRINISMAIAVVMILVGTAGGPKRAFAAAVIPKGTLMVSTYNGLVQEWDTSTAPPTFVRLLDTGTIQTAGSVFDVAWNFYVADFAANTVGKFDPTGALLGNFGSGYDSLPASVIVNSASALFAGQTNGTHHLLEFDPTGALVDTFELAPENCCVDLIDLSSDQCTMFYTSEGVLIKRYSVCTHLQLPDFNLLPLPSSQAFANKIRANHEVLVADTSEVTRLDGAGNQIRHYLASRIEPGDASPFLFALSLDRDGRSFWTADFLTSDVFKVDLATGNVITHFNAVTDCNGCGVPSAVSGLAMKGEIQVSNPPPVCTSATASAPKLWPADQRFVTENVLGVTDVSAAFTINIDGIRQDEPVKGDGTCPDGKGVGTNTAKVRSERRRRGNGRVYHIAFTANDINGNSCTGNVPVCVPHAQGGTCVDDGSLFDSTNCQ